MSVDELFLTVMNLWQFLEASSIGSQANINRFSNIEIKILINFILKDIKFFQLVATEIKQAVAEAKSQVTVSLHCGSKLQRTMLPQ